MGQRTNATKLNVAGLVLTAVGMVLQKVAGSDLYPTYTGPVVLVMTAIIVATWQRRWTAYLGLLVPLVLGVGAAVAAVMTGDFIEQLTDLSQVGIFVGSIMHVVGLVAAVAGGVGVFRDRPVRAATDGTAS
jgi:hypothetical protein